MSDTMPVLREHGNSYNIFILVLTIFSLAIMGVLLLPLDDDTRQLLTLYDNVISLIFLADFAFNLAGAKPKRAYFIGQRGWLDLLGSIPSFEFLPFTALFRLARLSRLARIGRLLGGKNRKQLVADVLQNRGQYATFITVLAAGMVLSVASVLVLQFESRDPDANIKTGGDAIWWGIVTLTTVGYGDFFPVTLLGRLTGVSVMLAGVGIIGALASILASLLVPPPKETPPDPAAASAPTADGQPAAASGPAGSPGPAASDAVAEELARLREEIAALRAAMPRAPD
jgi:voltage-gated potassium channel